MKAVKVGLPAVGALMLGTLLALRVTGLPPGHPSADEYSKAGRSARPGLWLTGEVVHEAVTNWDWVNQFSNPFGPNATELETRTWYGIPHSVTVLLVPRGDKLYLQSSAQTFRLSKKFPYSKAWWRNVERDPRVRLKIGGKIYEMTVALVQDRAEVARLRGEKDAIVKTTGADGTERVTEEWHYWRVFQRNVPEYGNGSAIAVPDSTTSMVH
jgi:F420H(2)-dependent quinone reductase